MGARRAAPAAKASGRYRFGEGPSPEYPVTTGKRRKRASSPACYSFVQILAENLKALGGLRHPRKDSPNTGWRNEGFRGFADYMQTEEFRDALAALIRMSRRRRVGIMCAEAVPWRCHRSLVADALSVRGVPVVEILSESNYRMHQLTPFAQVEDLRITYPPEQATLL
jgi:uncharacterized protein (DUF488 family)